MRYNLESGLPVKVDCFGDAEIIEHMDTAWGMGYDKGLKRLKVYFGAHAAAWSPAYGNPFIDGSFLNWYRDDATYDRPTMVVSPPKVMHAIGNFVWMEDKS